MMVGGGSTPFTVVYSDGDREINLGTVVIDPSMNFKRLVSLLSQRIGISPHNFSVFLAAVGSDRKIPITAKVNLATVAGHGSAYYFLVKRSRRFKRSLTNNKNPPANVMLLRREASVSASRGVDETPISGFRTMMALPPPPPHPPILDRIDYERRVRNLLRQKESFLMSMGIGGEPVRSQTRNGYHGGGGGAVCEVCLGAKLTGIDSGFHLCMYDKVIEGLFRSKAGPISRPAMNSDKYYCPLFGGRLWFSFIAL